jgi:DNA-directed RNA polymerase subunit RPC12/RpoP
VSLTSGTIKDKNRRNYGQLKMSFPSTDSSTKQAPELKHCRKCGHRDLMRIPRNWQDRLWEALRGQPMRRYRCGRCRTEQAVLSATDNS